jgi:hypothetical protein
VYIKRITAIIFIVAEVFIRLLKGVKTKSKIRTIAAKEQVQIFFVTFVNIFKFNSSI